MSLEALVEGVKSTIKGVHDYFIVPNKAKDMTQYALDHYLDKSMKEKLFTGKSQEEIETIYQTLEKKIQERMDYHSHHLNSLGLKIGKMTGLATVINSAYHMFRMTPFDNFAFVQYFLIGTKALMELPTMYSYFKDTKDVYGALEWIATKPLAGLIPILGPAIDLNVTQRVIKKRIIKEGVEYFLKEMSLYEAKEPLMDRIYNRVKHVTSMPEPVPA